MYSLHRHTPASTHLVRAGCTGGAVPAVVLLWGIEWRTVRIGCIPSGCKGPLRAVGVRACMGGSGHWLLSYSVRGNGCVYRCTTGTSTAPNTHRAFGCSWCRQGGVERRMHRLPGSRGTAYGYGDDGAWNEVVLAMRCVCGYHHTGVMALHAGKGSPACRFPETHERHQKASTEPWWVVWCAAWRAVAG